MLTIAVTSFFALTLIGALLTIGMMFHTYQSKIKAVIMAEFGDKNTANVVIAKRNHNAVAKSYRTNARRRPVQQIPLRAAA